MPRDRAADFGTIVVEFIPDQKCVESKSFKLYMFAYRNHQSFMESITNTILEDFVEALDPMWCRVKGAFLAARRDVPACLRRALQET